MSTWEIRGYHGEGDKVTSPSNNPRSRGTGLASARAHRDEDGHVEQLGRRLQDVEEEGLLEGGVRGHGGVCPSPPRTFPPLSLSHAPNSTPWSTLSSSQVGPRPTKSTNPLKGCVGGFGVPQPAPSSSWLLLGWFAKARPKQQSWGSPNKAEGRAEAYSGDILKSIPCGDRAGDK